MGSASWAPAAVAAMVLAAAPAMGMTTARRQRVGTESTACADSHSRRVVESAGIVLCTANASADADAQGAIIIEVTPGSVAGDAGLEAGDVIYKIGDVSIRTSEDAAKQLALMTSTADTVVHFHRDGHPYLVELRSRPPSGSQAG